MIAADITEIAMRASRRSGRKKGTVHTIATKRPICGMYMYRSAIDWIPTCTIPITGTSVPTNQNHPTKTHGSVLRARYAATDTPNTRSAQMSASDGEIRVGNGYKTDKFDGQIVLRTY